MTQRPVRKNPLEYILALFSAKPKNTTDLPKHNQTVKKQSIMVPASTAKNVVRVLAYAALFVLFEVPMFVVSVVLSAISMIPEQTFKHCWGFFWGAPKEKSLKHTANQTEKNMVAYLTQQANKHGNNSLQRCRIIDDKTGGTKLPLKPEGDDAKNNIATNNAIRFFGTREQIRGGYNALKQKIVEPSTRAGGMSDAHRFVEGKIQRKQDKFKQAAETLIVALGITHDTSDCNAYKSRVQLIARLAGVLQERKDSYNSTLLAEVHKQHNKLIALEEITAPSILTPS